MCPILSYQNIATLTPVYTFGIIFYNEDEHLKEKKISAPQVNSFAMGH